ncbi:HNH endonuclease [Flavobacterium hauense]
MKYFIQYHKAEELGIPLRTPVYNTLNQNFIRNNLRFFTKKRAIKSEIGNKCFLIVGFGKKGKMDFYLWSLINIEKVTFEDKLFWAEGIGFDFNAPIYLNNIEGFRDLKNFCGNFGLGLTDITTHQFCNKVIELEKDYEEHLEILKTSEEYWLNIIEARKLSSSERAKILKNSNPKPEKSKVQITVFKRNIYVIAETLERANGICEKCNSPAPFFRDKDDTQYLEVHHKIPLAENGDDTVENTIALCPNCHRHAHYGKKTY